MCNMLESFQQRIFYPSPYSIDWVFQLCFHLFIGDKCEINRIQPAQSSRESLEKEYTTTSLIRQLDSLLQGRTSNGTVRLALAGYCIPNRFSQQDIMDVIDVAETVGAIKPTLFKYDPTLRVCDRQEVLRFLQLSVPQRKSPSAIRDCGSHFWKSDLPIDKSIDMIDATSYSIARYNFMNHIIDSFLTECKEGNSDSLPSNFYRLFVQTYIARYWAKLSKEYTEIDVLDLPDAVSQVISTIVGDV